MSVEVGKYSSKRSRQQLSGDDKASLSLCFGGIESLLFLGSNFGASLERLSQLPPKTRKDASERFGPNGSTLLARGVEPSLICVKATHSVRVSDTPWKLEAWACPTNQSMESTSGAYMAREAHETLVWLVEHKSQALELSQESEERIRARGETLSWAVTVLHKMYAGILPAQESNDLAFLGELAPLALDTGIVLGWADTLSKRLRLSKNADPKVLHLNRKEFVDPRTALWDLLQGEKRKAREDLIREEALELWLDASEVYLLAKAL